MADPALLDGLREFQEHLGGELCITFPNGVGARRDPPLWMKPGDEIVVEIEGVGQLTNRVVEET